MLLTGWLGSKKVTLHSPTKSRVSSAVGSLSPLLFRRNLLPGNTWVATWRCYHTLIRAVYVREPAVTRGVTLPFFIINKVDITPVMTWLQTVNDVLGAAHGAGYSYLPSQNGIFPSGAELLRGVPCTFPLISRVINILVGHTNNDRLIPFSRPYSTLLCIVFVRALLHSFFVASLFLYYGRV